MWCLILPLFLKAELLFKENKGQWDQRVLFRTEFKGGAVYFGKNWITYQLLNQEDLRLSRGRHGHGNDAADPDRSVIRGHAFQIQFLSSASASVSGLHSVREYFNYYLGNDPSAWASHVRAFQQITYPALFPGIQLLVSPTANGLKYDYLLAAGADPAQIKFKVEGAKAKIQDGKLCIETEAGPVIENPPLAWQIINGSKKIVTCVFTQVSGTFGFSFPDGYNSKFPITIDPDLVFSTYSGSTADNFGYTATYDAEGNAYAAGSVFQIGQYPVSLGAFQISWAGGVGNQQPGSPAGTGTDIGITKYSADGLSRIYSTYLGGNGDELPHSIVVNSNEELFVFGTSGSSNFPTTPNAYDRTFAGGPDPGPFNGLGVHYLAGSDIIISRFNPDGTALMASTYVGGSANDGLNFPIGSGLNYNYADEVRGEIDIDRGNNVYVASCTRSADFPLSTQSVQNFLQGGMDGCVFKMDNNLSRIIWSTVLGGSEDDAAYSIAFDQGDSVYISGGTMSDNFPIVPGAFQTLNAGGRCDGFVAKVDPSGRQLLHSTYWGSSAYDQVYFVEVNRRNEVFLLGQTEAVDSTFIFNAAYHVFRSGQFLAKLNPDLSSRVWSTVFGSGRGRPDISPTAFLVDLCNKVYMAGWGAFGTLSTLGLPVTPDAFQRTTDGRDFYLMVLEDDASALSYATYFGGNQNGGEHVDGGTSRFDKKGVIYQSVCAGCGGFSDFPTAPANVVSRTNNSPNCNNAVFKFDFKLPLCIADFSAPPPACTPASITFNNRSLAGDSATFHWYFGDGDTSQAFEPTHVFDTAGVYTITLIVKDENSCNGADTAAVQLVILDGANDTLSNVAICPGASRQIGFTLSGNTQGISYRWLPDSTLSDPTVSDPFTFTSVSRDYLLIVSNGVCEDTFFQSVQVLFDSIQTIGAEINCPGDTARLFAEGIFSAYPLSFSWEPRAFIREGVNSNRPLVSATANTWFYVTGTNSLGCSYRDSAQLQVSSFLGNLQATATPPEIRYGDSSRLQVQPLTNESVVWQADSTLSSTLIPDPWAFPSESRTYYFQVEDPAGCTLSDSVRVMVKRTPCSNESIFVPDAFSPNNDGVNDLLFIRASGISEMIFRIYDRWGQLVFESKDPLKGWDGFYSGKLLGNGVFGYAASGKCADGNLFEIKGNVTLIR